MTWCLLAHLLSVIQGPQGFTGPAGEPGEPGASVSTQPVLNCSTQFRMNKLFDLSDEIASSYCCSCGSCWETQITFAHLMCICTADPLICCVF